MLFLSSLLLSVVFSLLRWRHTYTYAQLGASSQPRNCKIKLCRKRSNGTKTYENHLVERQTKQRDKKSKKITSFNKLITFLLKSLLRRLQASKCFCIIWPCAKGPLLIIFPETSNKCIKKFLRSNLASF